MRSPLGRARALGSARTGVHHWLEQRFSAIVLFLITPWALCSFAPAFFLSESASDFGVWLDRGANSFLLAAFLLVGIWHGKLGAQIIIEDYVHHNAVRIGMLISLSMLWLVGSAFIIWAIFAL